jgi:hypothetical protein
VLTTVLNTVDATTENLTGLSTNLNALLAKVVGVLNAASLVLPGDTLSLLPSVLQTLALPTLIAPSSGATTEILDLLISSGTSAGPPVDVDLLGLQITTSNIDAHLSAQTGEGQLLGNLLYNAANLLNPGGTATLLSLLAQLADLTFVLPAPAAAMAGDFNANGTVDAADYVVWRKQVSENATARSESRLITSGSDMTEEYGMWKANFGLTASARASSASSNSSTNESAESSAVAVSAVAAPAGDQHQSSTSSRTARTDGEQASRRIVDAAFDQIATNGRLPFEGPAAGNANRKAKLVADRRLNVNMQHDDALTAYLLSQLSASSAQAEDERIRFKEIDERFNEFATSGAPEGLVTGQSKDGLGDLLLAATR